MWLAHDAEAPAPQRGLPDNGMVAGCPDRLQIVVEGEIMLKFLHSDPPVLQPVAFLPQKNGRVTDTPRPAIVQCGPVEGLTTVQSHGKIEFRGLNHPRIGA